MTNYKFSLFISVGVLLHLTPAGAQHSDFRRLPPGHIQTADERAGNAPMEIDPQNFRKLNPADSNELIHADSTGRFVLGLSAKNDVPAEGDSADGEALDLTTLKKMPAELPDLRGVPEEDEPEDPTR